jgi:short-subunit dehydrogenase involved in D-alanine esterification of teichoic acids
MFSQGLFAGKKILITGGGTGLGRAVAERLLGLGGEIAICGRRKSVCDATADELMKTHAEPSELMASTSATPRRWMRWSRRFFTKGR